MIIRITFLDEKEPSGKYQMLFGNSYKKWQDQIFEYIYKYFCSKEKGANLQGMIGHISKVEVSREKWVGWGGLKWCDHNEFQQELNREGCQTNDKDNPNPRKYGDMIFEEKSISYVENYIERYFKK